VTDVILQRPDGIFETTRANLAESRRAGLELPRNGRFTPKLTYNLSGSLGYAEIEPTGVGGATETRSGATVRGARKPELEPDAQGLCADQRLHERRAAAGRRGCAEPTGMLNLGYRPPESIPSSRWC
jgi:hypothetical protein